VVEKLVNAYFLLAPGISSVPPATFKHMPFGTYIQASFWLSCLALLEQTELDVAQSFLPALAMP
jgi:hypothetical protein